ncbi:hypothetical protein F2Q70_00034593 [Brassica cretica]|uniref:Uncharacterized protein n=1 Tax=Brassica cretica TaxID=69181 RepID=A0A8S9GAE5_BRACR|nr:hypothetical protein F2Q68_00029462 [Brassica cretica]KAF2586765.1 hypothetical protein F2Q70_00034593 [Brassica cretica]
MASSSMTMLSSESNYRSFTELESRQLYEMSRAQRGAQTTTASPSSSAPDVELGIHGVAYRQCRRGAGSFLLCRLSDFFFAGSSTSFTKMLREMK